MKLQVGDRGFFGAKILCDGVELHKVVSADEEKGIAVCLALNDRGRTFVDPNDPDRAATVVRRGRILILPAVRKP